MPDAPANAAPLTFLLIHGAWQGAWAFDAWRPLLHARGWRTVAIDLPGNGAGPCAEAPASLAAYVACAARAAEAAGGGGPLVVVGHSGGGITATQLAEAMPERIAAVVHLAGIMLPSGVTFAELASRTMPPAAIG